MQCKLPMLSPGFSTASDLAGAVLDVAASDEALPSNTARFSAGGEVSTWLVVSPMRRSLTFSCIAEDVRL